MTDRLFARLRPEELDELAEASYRRRRREDLARAFASTRHPTSRRWTLVSRRPMFLFATGAVAAVAVGAIVVSTGVLPGTPGGGGSPVAVGSSTTPTKAADGAGASSAATRIDARSFLLAAADTALREPEKSGEYWYVRTRVASPADYQPAEFRREARRLAQQEQAEIDRIGGDESRLDAINEKYNKKLKALWRKYFPNGLPFEAHLVETTEVWRPKRAGGTNRVKTSDHRVVFPTPQDEAKWRELGSPNLLPQGKHTQDDNRARPLSIVNMNITMQNVGKLPTSKKALAERLRAQFRALPDHGDKEFATYLWQTTVDLMTAPTTPGTRAALFQVLADQPGITSRGEVEDAVGRKGIGLTVKDAEGTEYDLIINADTADLLEYSVVAKDADGARFVRETYEEVGWTDKPGRRPQG
jgi:hypothetical protein